MKYIPLFACGLVLAVGVSAVPVTFKVNMGIKMQEDQFDPASDIVDVRGAFNGWSAAELTDDNADGIFEGTVELADNLVGVAQEYKFVYTKLSDGVPVWESIDNRSFTPTSVAQTLSTVFFNDDDVVSLNIKAEIHFSVNMGVQITAGTFNENTDEVYVRGNKMGWGAPPEGLQLFEDALRPGIYTNTYNIDSILTGDLVEYKFTIWKPATAEPVWEEGANKTLTFDASEPDTDNDTYLEKSVGPDYFNGIGPTDALAADTQVTFSVNMQNATQLDGTPFDSAFEGVWLNGNFANWWGWGNAPVEYQMVDDGTNGDETAGDLTYSLTLTLPKGTGRMLDYKYAIASLDNEAAFADNHIRYIRAEGEYKLPRDLFGQMTKETPDGTVPDIGAVAIRKAENGQVTLSWTSTTGVRVQKSNSLATPAWADVAGSSGVSTITVPASGDSGFFRLFRP